MKSSSDPCPTDLFPHATNRSQYREALLSLGKHSDKEQKAAQRILCRTDLFFLIRYILHRPDLENDWLFDRCREVEAEPNGCLDLWAREHYKSTIITFGKSIQDILASHGDDPLPEWEGREVTIGIFSHTRPKAKDFLRQIKRELENNEGLKELFPDVLWANPEKDAPKWSEDDGLIMKRKGNPQEATVEAWGLVDSMPTGKHFLLRVYDDVVTDKSITTPEMMKKTTRQWELSDNLGAEGGVVRYIGTRYHFSDTYGEMEKRGVVKVRKYPITDDGTETGTPVFMSRERMLEKRRVQGPHTFACQMLLDPRGDTSQGFRKEWLEHYKGDNSGAGMNIWIVVDPANEKKKNSDYTAVWVIGLSGDRNYYALDMVRDRLNLTERGDLIFRLHKKYRPQAVGYERYGMQADISYLTDRMDRENYHFRVIELGGIRGKNDRIRRLVPVFEQGRFWLPITCYRTDYEGETRELVSSFIEEEYMAFPVSMHDDMLDSASRILDEDLGTFWPMLDEEPEGKRDRYAKKRAKSGGWMAA